MLIKMYILQFTRLNFSPLLSKVSAYVQRSTSYDVKIPIILTIK